MESRVPARRRHVAAVPSKLPAGCQDDRTRALQRIRKALSAGLIAESEGGSS